MSLSIPFPSPSPSYPSPPANDARAADSPVFQPDAQSPPARRASRHRAPERGAPPPIGDQSGDCRFTTGRNTGTVLRHAPLRPGRKSAEPALGTHATARRNDSLASNGYHSARSTSAESLCDASMAAPRRSNARDIRRFTPIEIGYSNVGDIRYSSAGDIGCSSAGDIGCSSAGDIGRSNAGDIGRSSADDIDRSKAADTAPSNARGVRHSRGADRRDSGVWDIFASWTSGIGGSASDVNRGAFTSGRPPSIFDSMESLPRPLGLDSSGRLTGASCFASTESLAWPSVFDSTGRLARPSLSTSTASPARPSASDSSGSPARPSLSDSSGSPARPSVSVSTESRALPNRPASYSAPDASAPAVRLRWAPRVCSAVDALLAECTVAPGGAPAQGPARSLAKAPAKGAARSPAKAPAEGPELYLRGCGVKQAIFEGRNDWHRQAASRIAGTVAALTSGADPGAIEFDFIQLALAYNIGRLAPPHTAADAAPLDVLHRGARLLDANDLDRQKLDAALDLACGPLSDPRARRVAGRLVDAIAEIAHEAFRRQVYKGEIEKILDADHRGDHAALHSAFVRLYEVDRSFGSLHQTGVARCVALIESLPGAVQREFIRAFSNLPSFGKQHTSVRGDKHTSVRGGEHTFVDGSERAFTRGGEPLSVPRGEAACALETYAEAVRAGTAIKGHVSAALKADLQRLMADLHAAATRLRDGPSASAARAARGDGATILDEISDDRATPMAGAVAATGVATPMTGADAAMGARASASASVLSSAAAMLQQRTPSMLLDMPAPPRRGLRDALYGLWRRVRPSTALKRAQGQVLRAIKQQAASARPLSSRQWKTLEAAIRDITRRRPAPASYDGFVQASLRTLTPTECLALHQVVESHAHLFAGHRDMHGLPAERLSHLTALNAALTHEAAIRHAMQPVRDVVRSLREGRTGWDFVEALEALADCLDRHAAYPADPHRVCIAALERLAVPRRDIRAALAPIQAFRAQSSVKSDIRAVQAADRVAAEPRTETLRLMPALRTLAAALEHRAG